MTKHGELLEETDEKMDTFLQTINDSVGTQLHGMNTTIAKMKEDDDRKNRECGKENLRHR